MLKQLLLFSVIGAIGAWVGILASLACWYSRFPISFVPTFVPIGIGCYALAFAAPLVSGFIAGKMTQARMSYVILGCIIGGVITALAVPQFTQDAVSQMKEIERFHLMAFPPLQWR